MDAEFQSRMDEEMRKNKIICEYEDLMESREWMNKIPALNFPKAWSIRIIPPFCGAVARFRAEKGDNSISVYLDGYDRLGYVGEPYWEIYPYEGDTFRCNMMETDLLINAIKKSFKEMEKQDRKDKKTK